MNGLFASVIILTIILLIIFVPIVRNHNKMVKNGTWHTFDCGCGYQGNYQDELDNHKKLTRHGEIQKEM